MVTVIKKIDTLPAIIVLVRSTLNHTTVCKLSVFDRNT